MCAFQFVLNLKKNFNRLIPSSAKKYIAALLISSGKKNCASMSYELEVPYNSIYEFLDPKNFQEASLKQYLIAMVHVYSTEQNKGIFIVDSTQIVKLYAKKLECCCYDFSNSMKLVVKGMSCVTSVWTNGKIVIPLDFSFWTRKKDLKNDANYKKKTDISKDLISELKDKIPFEYIALDGEYGSESFLTFLHKNNLKYSIRIPKNRRVLIGNTDAQLKKQPFFQLKKNERYKTATGSYKGIPALFTSQKRKGKNGTKQIVFVVSNLESLTPKQHILSYERRWPIEKMFRTLKQSLGIQHCQSNSRKKQRAHIYATFLAFAELEKQKIYKKKKSPEEILKIIHIQNKGKKDLALHLLEGYIM